VTLQYLCFQGTEELWTEKGGAHIDIRQRGLGRSDIV